MPTKYALLTSKRQAAGGAGHNDESNKQEQSYIKPIPKLYFFNTWTSSS